MLYKSAYNENNDIKHCSIVKFQLFGDTPFHINLRISNFSNILYFPIHISATVMVFESVLVRVFIEKLDLESFI